MAYVLCRDFAVAELGSQQHNFSSIDSQIRFES